uniref:Uncharacterized protein n=1 Tax=Moniliophthora roreri TaxID=221103 RepID=A0A0W0FUT2_MONRR
MFSLVTAIVTVTWTHFAIYAYGAIATVSQLVIAFAQLEHSDIIIGFFLGLIVTTVILHFDFPHAAFGMEMQSASDLEDEDMEFKFPELNSEESNHSFKLNKMKASGTEGLHALAKLIGHPYSGKKTERDGTCFNMELDMLTKDYETLLKMMLLEGSHTSDNKNDNVLPVLPFNSTAITALWAQQLLSECPEYQRPCEESMVQPILKSSNDYTSNLQQTLVPTMSSVAIVATALMPSTATTQHSTNLNATIAHHTPFNVTAVPAVTPNPSAMPHSIMTTTTPLSVPMNIVQTAPALLSQASSSMITPISKEQPKQIIIKKQVILFTQSQFPNPLQVSSTTIIDYKCPLKIDGKGILLNSSYRYLNMRWKALKGRWNKWKFIAFKFLTMTLDEFWAEFRDSQVTS